MKFGVLGDAKIARTKLLPAIRAAGHEVVHVGRRDAAAGVDPVWGDVSVSTYEEMLADPQVEAVYNPLPNHLHVPWSIRALEAGKPVLSEKPVALNLEELAALDAASRRTGLYVYDGFMVRYHPQWAWLRDLEIGRLKQVNAHFSYPPPAADNIRNIAAWGGGPVWDIGCYGLMAGQMLFDGTPRLVGSVLEDSATLDVEVSAGALVDFGGGQMLTITVSSGHALSQMVRVSGTEGWAQLDVPFNPPEVTTARWAHADAGKDALLGRGESVSFAACDQYQLMVEDFVTAVAERRASDFVQARDLVRILGEMLGEMPKGR